MTKYIGLLMVNGEDDILAASLDHNTPYLDCFYVLDGTQPNTASERICCAHPKCAGYTTDAELPRPPYPENSIDGYRGFLLQQAVAEHGHDNWFVILHGDELWDTDPRQLAQAGDDDGYVFDLPFYFPRAGEPWDYDKHPLDQLRWNLGPGWPEFRLFKGNEGVHYHPGQYMNTMPQGIGGAVQTNLTIRHYPYRSPEVQRARTQQHQRTQFHPTNYAHILERDEVYWTDEMIEREQADARFRVLKRDP